jgi:hypothetical protein
MRIIIVYNLRWWDGAYRRTGGEIFEADPIVLGNPVANTLRLLSPILPSR